MPSYVRPGIRKCAKNRALSDTHESEFFQPDYQAGGNLLHHTVHPESVCDLHEVSARLSRPCISRLMSAHNPRSVVILRDVQT